MGSEGDGLLLPPAPSAAAQRRREMLRKDCDWRGTQGTRLSYPLRSTAKLRAIKSGLRRSRSGATPAAAHPARDTSSDMPDDPVLKIAATCPIAAAIEATSPKAHSPSAPLLPPSEGRWSPRSDVANRDHDDMRALAVQRDAEHPQLRAAASLCLLRSIARKCPRVGATMGAVLDELERCIYADPPHSVGDEGDAPAERVYAAAFASDKTPVSRLLARVTYREHFDALSGQWAEFEQRATQLDMVLGLKTRVLNTAVGMWQRSLICRVFVSWRESTKRQKNTRKHLMELSLQLRRRDVMHSHLNAWRVLTTQRKVERDWLQVHDNLLLLEHNKAAAEQHIAELNEKHDDLRSQVVSCREAAQAERERAATLERVQEDVQWRGAEWQALAKHVLSFLAGLRERQSGIAEQWTKATMQHTAALWNETANRVLLGWVNQLLRAVPHRLTRKGLTVSNFSVDWRSGDAYLLLLAATFRDPENEAYLNAVDSMTDNTSKLALAVDGLQKLGVDYGIQPAEILQGIPDYNIVCVHALWRREQRERFEDRSSGTGSHRSAPATADSPRPAVERARQEFEDLSKEYLECSADHQVLDHYVLYLATCRAHGVPHRVLSRQEEKDAQREVHAYTTIQVDQLPELFTLKLAKTPEEQEAKERQNQEDLASIVEAITRNFTHIRRAFRHYCGVEPEPLPGTRQKQPSMDFSQFWQFCRECQLVDRNFTRAQAAALFADVNMRNRGSGVLGKDDPMAFNPDHLLVPSEFVQLLLRMSALKQQGSTQSGRGRRPSLQSPRSGGGVCQHAAAFEMLLHQEIIPRAGMTAVDTADFRLQLWSESVQAVLRRNRGKLLKIYRHYAQKERGQTLGKETGHLAGHHAHTMQSAELRRLFTDAQLLGKKLSGDDLDDIFTNMQDDTVDADSLALVYSEFEQVLVCAAAMLWPSPFEPLSTKAQAFLETLLYPGLARTVPDLVGTKQRKGKR
eukprot:TRINITY_DN18118_c0_g1_i1.p1 TRINITY_DN18118_c0_g1~~TRINITY_DN18118_c0_g1_i1.p1  ORF type:complete len:989 (+),score=353.61 TRINITY_DN18118_c0_g1_i1:55-2967(+)